MTQLRDKSAIVTGASSGIGRAAALLFARNGARVVLGARRADALAALVEEIEGLGGAAVAVPGDVTDPAFGEALVDAALARFGRLDVAFNNAGILGESMPFAETDPETWRRTLDVNLTGAFLCARPQLAAMARHGRGSVVFTSSFVGHTVGFPGMAAYAASKAGLIGLTRVLAAEFGASGIRVNALLPGGTDTPMAEESASSREALDYIRGLHALKRIADPEEIAETALFLVSDAAGFVTGTAMLADGGVSIARA